MALGNLDVFHLGTVVPSLETAMDAIGRDLGVSWAPVQERDQRVRTGSGEVLVEHIRFTYSREGIPHLELIESREQRAWRVCDGGALHHAGAFVDDVAAESARLVAAGVPLEFGGGAREQPAGFAYHLAAGGIRFELVDGSRRADFMRWFDGGSLTDASAAR